jgi:hypothetical protein
MLINKKEKENDIKKACHFLQEKGMSLIMIPPISKNAF